MAGSHWCVLVSRTTPAPAPGSDEINRAYEEGWVGNHTLAFIGDTLAENGDKVPELFIDLPQDEAGWKAPARAAGTATTTAPPAGVSQRRLTFTHHRRYPGLVNVPRHWVRAQSPCDGDSLSDARRRRRSAAVAYFPAGGEPRQLTHHASGIQSAFNWHPSGEWLGFALDCLPPCRYGRYHLLTDTHAHAPSADAIVFSPDGKQIARMEEVDGYRQLWVTQTGR